MFDILVTLLVRYRKKCNSQHDRSKKGRAGRPVQALLTNGAMGFTPPDQHELDCSLCTLVWSQFVLSAAVKCALGYQY